MDLGALVSLGVLYAILSVIGRIAKGGQTTAPGAPRRERVPGKPETLEDLLAEMRGELDRSREHEQLEEVPAPEAVSRPLPPPAVAQEVVYFDDSAQKVVARRIKEAEARNRALTPADHERFDRRIRRAPPVIVHDTRRRDALRRAMVWNEILGPPKGMQPD